MRRASEILLGSALTLPILAGCTHLDQSRILHDRIEATLDPQILAPGKVSKNPEQPEGVLTFVYDIHRDSNSYAFGITNIPGIEQVFIHIGLREIEVRCQGAVRPANPSAPDSHCQVVFTCIPMPPPLEPDPFEDWAPLPEKDWPEVD